jgi:hypothetical protein
MENNYPHLVIASLPEYIEPMDRGERYGDPLDTKLQESGLGEVTGGGSQMDENYQIVSVDLEIRLANLDSAVSLCISALESFGAPKGSKIVFGDEPNPTTIGFGQTEGVALVVDGVNLPPEVYEKYGLDELLDALKPELAGGVGELHGCNTLNETTELYFYGPSADKILDAIARVQPVFPLCQNSKTRKIDVISTDAAS